MHGKHHLAICDAHLKSTVSGSPAQADNRNTDTGVRQPAPNSSSSRDISGTKINECVIGCAGEHSPNMNEVILVQTAQAKVYSPADSGLSAKIRVLLELNSPQPGSVHYLPHHEVVHPDKSTTRVRIVYDGSSKRKNEVSLNETLYRGPPLTPLILDDILLLFRMFGTVLIGDLEKAFLSITPEQRDLLRFIWVDDITK